MDRRLRALNRFGLGARIGEARGVMDPRGWLSEQVHARHAALGGERLPTGDLFEGRNLRPTLDTRALLKSVITGVFDLTASQADRVFPGSQGIRSMRSLMG